MANSSPQPSQRTVPISCASGAFSRICPFFIAIAFIWWTSPTLHRDHLLHWQTSLFGVVCSIATGVYASRTRLARSLRLVGDARDDGSSSPLATAFLILSAP